MVLCKRLKDRMSLTENNKPSVTQSKMGIHQDSLRLLVEMRTRLIRWLFVLFVLLAGLVYFANELYTFLALPLLAFLPEKHLIATQIVSPFFVPFRLAFNLSLILSMPVLFYQVWAFISPALYTHEKRMIWPFLFVSVALFYVGMSFAYFIIFPMMFRFLAHTAPVGVVLSPDIGEYLDFALQMLLTFGVLFEIPIVMVVLVLMGVMTRARYIAMRRYAIVCAFIAGMFLAPPDVMSQIMLAVPIWLLYELGIVMTRFVAIVNKDLSSVRVEEREW